jgi:mannonate dehydratase
MKIGLGLYRHMLTPDNYRFARQAGATHIVAHLTNYFANTSRLPGATQHGGDYGSSQRDQPLWTYQELRDLRAAINAEGLELAAIENFDPAHWHDVLLDGPRKREQLDSLKTLIRDMGRAGIPAMGYNFSIAGVWGWVRGPFARGGAESVGVVGAQMPAQTPIPNGQVWNMTYDPDAPPGTVGAVSTDQLWARLAEFLREIVPVAEEAGVRLGAHPDDPPFAELRGTARLVYRPELYQRLIDLVPSRANGLELCIGSLSEMAEGAFDLYEAVDRYSKQDKLAYVHFRNVLGKVPNYHEVFIDEGDVDMYRVLGILTKNGYDGVIIPDHTPQMTCPAPWHAGMAYALGWIRAALMIIEREGAKEN